MKVIFSILAIALCLTPSAKADASAPRSISELAALSNTLVHHYDCTADLLLSPSSVNREVTFSVSPLIKGEGGSDHLLQLQADKLTVSANGQMLSIEWIRGGKALATVKTMVTDSTQRNYVLIVIDPTNPEQQAQISCNAVTFAQANGQPQPAVGAK